MYQQHFGLTEKPFRPSAEGAAVFVGPQQAKVLTSLKKALASTDSVLAVSGAVGVGKTTIVTRALETNTVRQMVAWIGRMQLGPDEVLDLLLAGFGVSRRPKGTIQRFAAFKRLLNDWATSDTRVVIVVEDAMRVGNDALLEMESLTAADTGETNGANIILMGRPEINDLLNSPPLARLRQRSRRSQVIQPFSTAEVRGYLKHCIRAAGGEYSSIFSSDAAPMAYRCSRGIPRVINNLCESALLAAAESNSRQITAALLETVATEIHGLEPMPADAVPDEPSALPPVEVATSSPQKARGPAASKPAPTISPAPVAPVASPAKASPPKTADSPTLEELRKPESDTETLKTLPEMRSAPTISEPAPAPPPTPPKAAEPATRPVPPESAEAAPAVAINDPAPVEAQFAAPKKRVPPLEMTGAKFLEGSQDEPDSNIPTLAPEATIIGDDPVAPATTEIEEELPELSDTAIDLPDIGSLQSELGDLPDLEVASAVNNQASKDDGIPTLSDTMVGKSLLVDGPQSEPSDQPPASVVTPAEPPGIEVPVRFDEEPSGPVPDLDALEAAIAAAHRRETPGQATPEDAGKPPLLEPELHEITLDNSLEEQRKASEEELARTAEELSKAESLEDISDVMAETLFGEELEQAAAEALGMGPLPDTEADDGEEVSPVMLDPEPEAAPPRTRCTRCAERILG